MLDIKELKKLMERAKAGDTAAFALLYDNFYTPIFRYVFHKLSDGELAEDITQTVFMKAFKARENFNISGPSPIAYFYTIARNLVTDTYRKKDKLAVTIDSQKDEDFWDRIPDSERDPMAVTIEKEAALGVQQLLDVLNEDHRAVIEMKFIQDLSNTEIADKTGKSEANIRQIQVRALRKLKQAML